jgi:hypothetical protein
MSPRVGRLVAVASSAAVALCLCMGAAGAAPILADDFEGRRTLFERIEGTSRIVPAGGQLNGPGGFGSFFRTMPGNEYVVLGNRLTSAIRFGPERGPSSIVYDLDALAIPDDATALRIRFDFAFRQVPRRSQPDLFAVALGTERCLTVSLDEQGTAECRIEIQPDNDLVFRLVERITPGNSAVGIDNLVVEALFDPVTPPGTIVEPPTLALVSFGLAGLFASGVRRTRRRDIGRSA